MRALGESLGISSLEQRFGELDMGLAMNYYPICPQPDLTLGLSSHSDVGGITILLQDEHVWPSSEDTYGHMDDRPTNKKCSSY